MRSPVAARKGQAAVELALSVTVLLLIALGAVQFGKLYAIKLQVEHAAREGARFASVHVLEPGSETAIIQHTKDAARDLPEPDHLDVRIDTPTEERQPDKPVAVTVIYPYVPTVPLVKSIIPLKDGHLDFQAHAEMRIEG